MRASTLVTVAALSVAALSLGVATSACDDLNKPAYVPKSEPRKSCFSDVECPGAKCVKTGGEVQGRCEAPDAGTTITNGAPDASAPRGDDDRPVFPPAPNPEPGDIHI
jgi:hypothetical protein